MELLQAIKYHEGQITSRSLSKKLGVKTPMMLFAYAKGESVSQEVSEFVKVIHVLEGTLNILTEQEQLVSAGEMVQLAPGTRHGLLAVTDCKFLQLELPPKE